MKTTAVVVTYNPPAEFADHLDAWMSQVDQLVVVDNGSAPAWRDDVRRLTQTRLAGVEFIWNETNLGIAASLNRGFARLMDQGHELAFVFDQDSRPSPGMVAEMLQVYDRHPDRSRVAIVAPNIDIPSSNNSLSFLQPYGPFLFRRVRCTDQRTLEGISVVITSGALYNLRAYSQIGPFREDLFIDYVDTEYCLRARQHGYNLVVACHARLQHRFGNQRERRFGPITMHPSFHSPLRWYYISRNRVPVTRTYALRFPHWFLYEFVLNMYGLVRLVLFEDRKADKFLAMLLGAWDGLLNRLGPISDGRRSLFARHESEK